MLFFVLRRFWTVTRLPSKRNDGKPIQYLKAPPRDNSICSCVKNAIHSIIKEMDDKENNEESSCKSKTSRYTSKVIE